MFGGAIAGNVVAMNSVDIRLTLMWKNGLPIGSASLDETGGIPFAGWLELAQAVQQLVPETA
jgi:hypothetical protein